MSDCIIKVIINIGTITDKHNGSLFKRQNKRSCVKSPFLVYVRTYDAIPFDSWPSADYGKLPISYTH